MDIQKTLQSPSLTAVVRTKPMAAVTPTPGIVTKTPGESISLSKVAQMRAAIEAGTFKVDASRIADGLLRSGDLTR